MRLIKLVSFLLFISTISLAQNMNNKNNYNSKWKTVEEAFQKGLNATAEKEIVSILKLAKAEKNVEQTIKAICSYRVSLRDRDEKARLNDIKFFKSELKDAVFPVNQILHSMLGDLYWSYYQDYRWQILDRTKIESNKKETSTNDDYLDQIETWSAPEFYEAAFQHYQLSLAESNLSKQFDIKKIQLLLEQGINTQQLRPTLYDFLVHRAIGYFSEQEIELTQPAYAFEIDDVKAFSPAKDFVKSKFKTSDTISRKFQVLKLYQDILSFHLNDTDPSALIDADIARVKYVFTQGVMKEKESLYTKALEKICNDYPNNKQISMALFHLAEMVMNGGNGKAKKKFNPTSNNEDHLNYIEAKKRCEAIIAKFPDGKDGESGSEGTYGAHVLLQQIEQHILSTQTEKVVLPNQAFLAMIQFRNIKKVYCKVIKLSNNELREFDQDYDTHFKQLLNRNPVTSWTEDLPIRDDYKMHSTEIMIKGLPLGAYALFVSESQNFEKDNYTTLSLFNVSNLAYIASLGQHGKESGLYVVNRDSGEPISGATIKSWITPYDYNTRKHGYKEGNSYTTDINGYSKLLTDIQQAGYLFEVAKNDDHLFIQDYLSLYDQSIPNTITDRTFFFTDRSMYRPGQTIYFKGIMVQTKGAEQNQHQILKNRKTTVSLMDVNYQLVKQQEFITNEFGSFSGTFIAPEGLLTGMFHIQGEGGQSYFNIEEYKRPKFEVNFDTLKSTFKLNDIIQLTGRAKAYVGNAIDGATVKYRVTRQARFPYYWCFYRWGQPASAIMEIEHGITTTKSDGSFEISFKAIPDESIDKNTMPIFDYHIEADITDLNGETRTGISDISVSYQALIVSIEAPQVNNIDSFEHLVIHTKNLSENFIETSVTLTCKKLKSPSKTYRSRLWQKVEINHIPEIEFRKNLPLDEYNNENDYLQWPEEKTVWTKTFQSTKDGKIAVQNTKYDEGWYMIEAKSLDKFGEQVIDKKYIRLSSFSNPMALPNDHLLVTDIKIVAQPGESAKLGISVPFEKVNLLYRVSNSKTNAQWLMLSKTKKFEYKVTEAERGGFYMNAMYIKNNRWYQVERFISVPWTNKQLAISLETFRDKILPGSEQEWKLKITGSNKEKVSAELLATMYDASLDAFSPHRFNGLDLFNNSSNRIIWNAMSNFISQMGRPVYYPQGKSFRPYEKSYFILNWSGLVQDRHYYPWRNTLSKSMRGGDAPMMVEAMDAVQESAPMATKAIMANGTVGIRNERESSDEELSNGQSSKTKGSSFSTNSIQLRSNFSETAFFFPDLHTDAEGNIILKFKAPDALTKWKLLAFGHTQDLKSSLLTNTAVTQKDLMIVPNTPRFFREGDKMVYSAKVTNLSDRDLDIKAMLQLFDGMTEEPIDINFANKNTTVLLALKKGESKSVSWNIEIPNGFTNPVMVKTYAVGRGANFQDVRAEFSDGEQNMVPVLLNSMLVTETLPLPVRTNSTKEFKFEKLLNSKSSKTLRNYNLTLEYTSNPAWYAIQALPYLTDYPYECAEQTFNRYYANVLATHIANSTPKIKEIFSKWESTTAEGSKPLASNLSKNQELKSALLQETPWVLDAKNEEDQKRNIATLFNLNRMSKELERTTRELELMQTPNGGFTWFKGMPDDRYMTQYIITGIGRLMHLKIDEVGEPHMMTIVEKAIPYLDARIKEDYDELVKNKVNLEMYFPNQIQIQYLYLRSFFLNSDITSDANKAFNYFKERAKFNWLGQNKYMQGMLALALHRYGDKTIPRNIIQSLRENAIHNEEMGMYWKDLGSSYWWYEAPIEAQSILIEAFKEVALSEDEVDELKIWLLKNKQTQNWKTTKATADACYALLLNGTYWLSSNPEVNISLGNKKINSSSQQQEAGTGYFKKSFTAEDIDPAMGKIRVEVRAEKGSLGSGVKSTTWGAVYWQYFENLDKITSSETPLSLKKQLFIERNSDKGPVLIPISNNEVLKVGDKVKVRIELRVDREMEYVHMKDMRAACFEPINVLSGYHYQGGLGYYESTKDASTNFFFNWLRKGTYVFEYPMFVTNKGDFSNGIATIQCMYAPEFSSHSEGIRVNVK